MVAVAAIVNVVVIVVEFTTVIVPTVTPVPDTATVVPVAVKFVPVSVTGTAVPRTPVFGATETSVGIGGLTTVNVSVLLVPPGVETRTVLAVSPAVGEIVNVVVTVVEFKTVIAPAVTPDPETATVVPIAVKFV